MNQTIEVLNTPLIVKYNEVMNNYRNGVYGNKHLLLSEIFQKAGVPNLLKDMSFEELDYLSKISTSGMTRMMFSYAKDAKVRSLSIKSNQHFRRNIR